MTDKRPQCESYPAAALTIGCSPVLLIDSEASLQEAMKVLGELAPGEAVRLTRNPKHFIEAVRHGELWSVTVQRGSWLSRASFTAEMTTDYSARRVQEAREAGSIGQWFRLWLQQPAPARALSLAQVETLFGEFFCEKRFSVPQSGA